MTYYAALKLVPEPRHPARTKWLAALLRRFVCRPFGCGPFEFHPESTGRWIITCCALCRRVRWEGNRVAFPRGPGELRVDFDGRPYFVSKREGEEDVAVLVYPIQQERSRD